MPFQNVREVISKIRSLSKASIVDQLNEGASKAQCNNRRMFIKVLSSLQFLLRQGLAIIGHKDEESNLHRLLKLRALRMACKTPIYVT